jgi:anti-sigma factor RsiW
MTCRKAKKLIPLYAGDDLRPRLARAVRVHIDACPACRRELEDYRLALARLKAAAGAEGVPDWGESEWKALMARIRPTAAPETRWPLFVARPRWAAASALGALLCLVVLSMLFRDTSLRPGRTPEEGRTAVTSENPRQDKLGVTMISPETGLQVVWFLDKNFDWKGDQQ